MTITTPSNIIVRLQGQLQGQSCPGESYDLTVDYSQPVGQFLLVTKFNVTLRMDSNNNKIDITPYGGGGGECLHQFLRKGTVV